MAARDRTVGWEKLEAPGPVPGVTAAAVHGDQLSAALYRLEPGTVVPEHAHENEEFGQVIRGSLELSCEGASVVLAPGQAFLLPGGVRHSARAGDDGCELLECYAPPRAAPSPPQTGEPA